MSKRIREFVKRNPDLPIAIFAIIVVCLSIGAAARFIYFEQRGPAMAAATAGLGVCFYGMYLALKNINK